MISVRSAAMFKAAHDRIDNLCALEMLTAPANDATLDTASTCPRSQPDALTSQKEDRALTLSF